ncbi:MAG: Ldh family oxidoreductase [Firmicutes bacterium]|nr:Ldh family oxidoreductase [Bacillota bacterium]
MSTLTVNVERLTDFCIKMLERAGLGSEDARIASKVLVAADMRGVSSHGTVALRTYVKQIRGGGMNPKANIEIVREGPAWAIVDGNAGMGVVTAYKATKIAIEKAKKCGIGIVGVRNGMHFGAAAYYAMMMAEEDMIGLAMSNVDINMTVTGAAGRVIGNNPFAYAAPAGEEKPIVLDIAMSVAAGGKINVAREEGKSIPEGWLVDAAGNPTTDPWEFLRGGALVPFAGHKGYGLALMVEILAGVMTGAAVTKDIGCWVRDFEHPCNEGFTFIAIDVGALMPIHDYKARMDALIRQIRNSPKAEGVERIYLPGEMEHEREEKAKVHGIVLGEATLSSLKGLAMDLGLEDELIWG